jgi:hypothetical protein
MNETLIERRRRVVRYINADLTIALNQCRATVELRRDSGEVYVGESVGRCLELDSVETAARAALNAACSAAGVPTSSLRLQGVSLVDRFGARTVVVTIFADEQEKPLVGSCVITGDTSRAAALAVLNATNRFLELG